MKEKAVVPLIELGKPTRNGRIYKDVYDIDKTSMYEGKMISVNLDPAAPTRLNPESLTKHKNKPDGKDA